MKEILEKFEELKKLGVSIRILNSYDLQYGYETNEFDMFHVHPDWDENTLITELTKKLIDVESKPWLFHLKRNRNDFNLCDTCKFYSFQFKTIMESVNVPIKFGTCHRNHFSDQKNIPPIDQCTSYMKSNG